MDKVINNIELVKYISDSQDLSYIAVITTPWHLMGFSYIWDNYVDKSEKGLLLIAKHSVSGFCLDYSDVRKLFNENLEIMFYQYLEGEEEITLRGIVKTVFNVGDKRTITIIAPEKPWIRLGLSLKSHCNCGLRFIVFDEGLGTYFRKTKTYYYGTDRIKFFIKAILEKCMMHRYEIIDKSLFSMKGNSLIKNETVVTAYKSRLNEKYIHRPAITNEVSGKYVIINTQTYHDNGEIDSNADLEVIGTVVEILKKYGFRVFIKPHPRDKSLDRYKDLHVEEIDAKISQEEYIAIVDNKPSYVIGFTTTTLVTLSLFFDIQTISLANFVDSSHIHGAARGDFSAFKALFGETVLIPGSIGDFERILVNG